MCENCPDDEIELVELRFVGGAHVKGRRGPYRSYETGKTYMMRPGYVGMPWWESLDAKDAAVEDEPGSEYLKEIIEPAPSRGLTKAFNQSTPPTDNDFIHGMDDATLKYFITGNGGKVDGRWGRTRLIEEAKKLQ